MLNLQWPLRALLSSNEKVNATQIHAVKNVIEGSIRDCNSIICLHPEKGKAHLKCKSIEKSLRAGKMRNCIAIASKTWFTPIKSLQNDHGGPGKKRTEKVDAKREIASIEDWEGNTRGSSAGRGCG